MQIRKTKGFLIVGSLLFSDFGSISGAQNVNADGSFPSCEASSDMIFGTNGWIYESWEWGSAYQFTSATDIVDMNNAFKKRGINLIFVPVPNRTVKYSGYVDLSKYKNINFSVTDYTNNWNSMINTVNKLGVNIVNVLPAVQKYTVGTRGETFYYPRDHHWTTSGAETSSQLVADMIKGIIKSNRLNLKPTSNVLKVVVSGYNSGSFGDHYNDKCKNRPPNMDAYKATNAFPEANLLEANKPDVEIFGDSFGLAAPDNNFSEFVEHYSGLHTVNYSVPGIGPLGALAGYIADPKINQQLPSFVVVPTLSWLTNDSAMYRQVTAAISGCTKRIPNLARIFKSPSSNYTYITDTSNQAGWNSLHLSLNSDAKQVNLEIHYDDSSMEKLSLLRNSNEYYKGDKRNFYVTFNKGKKVADVMISVDDSKSFSGHLEMCNIG